MLNVNEIFHGPNYDNNMEGEQINPSFYYNDIEYI